MKHDVSDKVRDLLEKRHDDDTAASSIRDRSGKVRRQALMLSFAGSIAISRDTGRLQQLPSSIINYSKYSSIRQVC